MIDYKETKKNMEIRGVEFTDAQFSMCLMISVGVDEYDAYMASIVPNRFLSILGVTSTFSVFIAASLICISYLSFR